MSAERAPLSACIIARDEADRIGPCLESLAWCDEIVVVDAHSQDDTRAIAAAHGARVVEHAWQGHVRQKDFAVGQASHDWVLCIDADERVSAPLRAEIQALQARGFPEHAGWEMPRLSEWLGRWIRHGSWYPDRQLRLFDRRRGGWTGRDPHDRVELRGSTGRLEAPLQHHPYRDLADHLATIERYTTTTAELLHAEGRRARLHDIVLRPPWRFFRFYVLERGLLEGWRGLVMAYLAAHYVRLKYVKLWLLARGPELEGRARPPATERLARRLRAAWRPARQRAEYLGYRLGVALLRRLPEGLAYRQAEALAGRVFDRGGPHARVALANLGVAFPEKTEAERRALGRRSFVHFAWGVLDAARSPLWSDAELQQRLEFEGTEHFEKAVAGGRGFLVLTPHLGSFELALRAVPLWDIRVTVIGRPLPNPWIRRDVDAERTRSGAELILHRNVARRMLQALAEGRAVVVMNDQYARRTRSLLAPFLGARAHTSPGLATLSLRSQAPVLPIFLVRLSRERHRLVCLPPIAPERRGSRDEDVARLTARYNEVLEEIIRRHPEQYLWSHRRFRNSPDVPADLYPAEVKRSHKRPRFRGAGRRRRRP